MKKIWIALVVVTMMALICTVGMITVFAQDGGQEICTHANMQGLYDKDEHWSACPDCGWSEHAAHVFEIVDINGAQHARKCACGRVDAESIEAHVFVLVDAAAHRIVCSGCGVEQQGCVYDQVVYYNDAYHTYACVCGAIDPNGAKEVHVMNMVEMLYDETSHWYGCACGYGVEGKADHVWGTDWVSDGTHHWKECVDCDAKTAPVSHSGGSATCLEAAACAECGTSYDSGAYVHDSEDLIYSKNHTHHTAVHACCGEPAVSVEPHEFENSVCTDCGYVCNHDVAIGGMTHSYTSTGNDTHEKRCNNCAKTEEIACFGGEATCMEKAVCEDCKTAYGAKDPDNHVDTTWIEEADGHYAVCDADKGGCAEITQEKQPHDWSEKDGVCAYENCDYACAHEGEDGNWMQWSNEGDAHKYTCKICGFEDESKAGVCEGGTATCMEKAVCGVCELRYGEIDPDNHVDTTWIEEADGHYAVCDADKGGCAEIAQEKQPHDWSEKDGICAYENCDYACAHAGEDGTWMQWSNENDAHKYACVICGFEDASKAGSCSDSQDGATATCVARAVCTECNLPYGELNTDMHVVPTWKKDADGHYAVCDADNGGCGEITQEKQPHDWSAKDGVCVSENCRYECAHEGEDATWMEWSNEGDVHKYTCNNCGFEKADEAGSCSDEQDGATATCVARAVCTKCRLPYGELNENNHVDTTWKKDADGHYAVCDEDNGGCGVTVYAKEIHDWSAKDGVCVSENCNYECLHSETSAEGNVASDDHSVTCITCQKILEANAPHDWVEDDVDPTNSKCRACNAICMHIEISISIDSAAPKSLKVFSNTEEEGVWKHKASCSRCNYVDQEGECTAQDGAPATCVTPAVCGICENAFGTINTSAHNWVDGKCQNNDCGAECPHEQVTGATDDGEENDQHSVTCTLCQCVVKEDCYGGDATCMAKAYCEGCGVKYGTPNPNQHDLSCRATARVEKIEGDATYHDVYYDCLGGVPTKEEHVFDPTSHKCECEYEEQLPNQDQVVS